MRSIITTLQNALKWPFSMRTGIPKDNVAD